jgi:hypothetical protein
MALKRDRRFVPERHTLDLPAARKLTLYALLGGLALLGLGLGAGQLYRALAADVAIEMVVLQAESPNWKSKPDDHGGRSFANKGLEINKIQAELFDAPVPEEIVLAPPPASF